MMGVLLAGLLAGYGIAMPVGAVATYLVALTARTSLKIGASAALGVATADGLYALIATIGGSTLAQVIQPIMLPMRWASALVLLSLATWTCAKAIGRYRMQQTGSRPDEISMSAARAYLGLLGMTMMNPITVIYFVALVLGTQTAGNTSQLEQAVFVLAAFAASASWQLLLAGGGALLGRILTSSRGRLMTAAGSSFLIAALAVQLVISPP